MRAIVIGAGIGGLTAALTLRRAGIDVHVFEQAPRFAEVGAGIQISPNATRVLHRVGLTEALRVCGIRPLAVVFRRFDDGRVLGRDPLGEQSERIFGAPYYHFQRADLLEVLRAAAPKEIIHPNSRCLSLESQADRVVVRFEDGTSADADVAIGADGIHSSVRTAMFGPESPHFSGDMAYRGLVPAGRLAHLGLDVTANVWWGPNRHFVHYFVGRGGGYVNFVGIVPAGEWRLESWTAKGEVHEALAEFAAFHPVVREIVAGVDSINKWAIYDRDPLPRWSKGRVTLIGDAAHAMLPYMAQGAVQAIEDAAVLARCLEQVDAPGVEVALRRYEEIRKPRATRCQEGSRSNRKLYHMPDGEDQRLRDANLGSLTTLPSVRSAWLYSHDVEAEFDRYDDS